MFVTVVLVPVLILLIKENEPTEASANEAPDNDRDIMFPFVLQ